MVKTIRSRVHFRTVATVVALALSLVSIERSADRGALWQHPVPNAAIAREFEAPVHEYGPGHRGVDYQLELGAPIKAPAEATVYFSGTVAGRAVLTLIIAERWLVSFEPVSEALTVGSRVSAGETIGFVGVDGRDGATSGYHERNILHIGVRLDGEYLNPELLFTAREYPILLPCCERG